MTTSVAMCTYNGAQFIEEQLESILNQSLPIDEIVICDDGSTDGTIAIIQQYINRFPNRIFLYQNTKALGVCANFAKAIDLCTKDCILLSDQDDVWITDKAQIIVKYFERNPEKSVIISNANLIDDFGQQISNLTLFDVVGFTEQLEYFDKGFALEIFLQANRATGCTMAVCQKFKPHIHINLAACANTHYQIHDGCIAMSAIIKNMLGYISIPLTLYRQHLSQICGLGEYISTPLHFPSPLIRLTNINVNYGIYHPRIEMQTYRNRYIKSKGGILLHINKYYTIYGVKKMWYIMFYDIYKRMTWIVLCSLKFFKK